MSLDYLTSIPNYENLPASLPPPGVVPNFQNPKSLASHLYVESAICLSLSAIAAAIRAYTKAKLLRNHTKDDISYFVAVALCVTFTIMVLILVHNGAYGVHTWDVQLKVLTVDQIRLALVVEITYGLIIWAAKIPLLLMYLEIFGSIKWLRYMSWAVLILTGLFTFSTVVVIGVVCSPETGFGQLDYLSAISSESCGRTQSVGLAQGSVNVAFDLFLLLLPMQPIWSLRLSTSQKLAVSALVLTGIFAIACSCASMWFRVLEKEYAQGLYNDSTWYVAPLWMTMVGEMTCAMIIPAAPAISIFWARKIRPLFTKIPILPHRSLGSGTSSTLRAESSNDEAELPKEKDGDTSTITMTREYTVHSTYAA